MMPIVCIYHANCADGFSAAWVVLKALGKDVEFHPASYGDPPPDVTKKFVIMVDFSYKRPVLLEMAERAAVILVLDHHKSAEEDLRDLPSNVVAKFDMEHSGAMMAWKHFFPDREPPRLLNHIEDRDLWRFRLPYTREIQACLFSYPYEFYVWDTLMATDTDVLAGEGAVIERKHLKDIRELLGVMTRKMTIGGYDVPVANLPYTLSSDACHVMAENEPFAACYYDKPGYRNFGLRSSNDGIDVSEIAKGYGGGGHRHAAGFRVELSRLLEEGLL